MEICFQDVTIDVENFIKQLKEVESLKKYFLNDKYAIVDKVYLKDSVRIIETLVKKCEGLRILVEKENDKLKIKSDILSKRCDKLIEENEELKRYCEKLNHELNIKAAEKDKEAIEKENEECKFNGPFMQNITIDDLIDILIVKSLFGDI